MHPPLSQSSFPNGTFLWHDKNYDKNLINKSFWPQHTMLYAIVFVLQCMDLDFNFKTFDIIVHFTDLCLLHCLKWSWTRLNNMFNISTVEVRPETKGCSMTSLIQCHLAPLTYSVPSAHACFQAQLNYFVVEIAQCSFLADALYLSLWGRGEIVFLFLSTFYIGCGPEFATAILLQYYIPQFGLL